jgi:two-component system sensor histidine kinase BaeS
VSYVVTFVIVRRSLEQNALANLRSRSDELQAVVNQLVPNEALSGNRLRAAFRAQLRVALRATDVRAVFVTADGRIAAAGADEFLRPPDNLSVKELDPAALAAGHEVSGRTGNTVYVATPARKVGQQTLVVVATDEVKTNVLRRAFPLMVLSGLILVAGAFAVALWLANRLTRPIAAVEQAAGRLAAGDLSARAEVPPNTDDELAVLATTLNRMAEQLEHTRGSERAFLLSISHDLRTPLTSIRGYAEALADGTIDDADPDARLRAATVIGTEARRLERLVRDLLDLSRLDSHQFSLSPRPCDATDVARDAATAFAPQAADLGITLAIAPASPIAVDMDPDRAAQIVANLVENALKYANARVEVRVALLDPTHFEIAVLDDGPGIPPAELGLVFDRLYTVRAVPGRSVGTGLGLAIVRELAGAMGGNARAEVDPATPGTCFVVTLPTNVARP